MSSLDLDLTARSNDPAASVVSTKLLNSGPIGVPDLEIAAELFKLPLREVEQAARHVTPWLHSDGSTRFWSLRQLARRIALNRAHQAEHEAVVEVEPDPVVEVEPEPPPRRVRHGRGPGGGRGLAPMLTREEAAAAVPRAREVGVKAAAVELGVSHGCLAATWSRYGIKGPGPGYHARQHPGGHKLTKDQAAAAAKRAKEIGRDRVAVELGVGTQTLWNTWRRHGIKGPGRANGAALREARRRAARRTMQGAAA